MTCLRLGVSPNASRGLIGLRPNGWIDQHAPPPIPSLTFVGCVQFLRVDSEQTQLTFNFLGTDPEESPGTAESLRRHD